MLAIIFFGGRTSLSYYVDVLWFLSLGYGEVFFKTLRLQWEVFTVFEEVIFIILYGSFRFLKLAHLPELPDRHTILIGGQPFELSVSLFYGSSGLVFRSPLPLQLGSRWS